jgi:hypothetical protein
MIRPCYRFRNDIDLLIAAMSWIALQTRTTMARSFVSIPQVRFQFTWKAPAASLTAWFGHRRQDDVLDRQCNATIYAFDFSIEQGTISNRRVFVRFDDTLHGKTTEVPDGLCVDAEGCV